MRRANLLIVKDKTMATMTMPAASGGAVIPPSDIVAAMPIGGAINAIVGTTSTVISAPKGATFLVLQADSGDFRVRQGDHSGGAGSIDSTMPAAAIPTVSVSDGTAGFRIASGTKVILPAATITAKGYASGSALSYYFI